jgi:hypothetical protein
MKQRLAAKGWAVGSAVALSALAFAPAVSAAQAQTQVYQANLTSLNKSGTTGTATVKVKGNKATVTVDTTGASAGLVHAQHIHIGGKNVCPTKKADKNNDGVISTVEGQPAYGKIKVSLTTKGKVGAKSGLAVKRFPTASKKGKIHYQRTFTLPDGVSASDIANGVVVQHGVASLFGNKGKYDGKAKSQLDKNLPLEATAPAACGKLTAAPSGGASTGGGSTAGTEDVALFAIGGAAVLAAGVGLGLRQRGLAAERK